MLNVETSFYRRCTYAWFDCSWVCLVTIVVAVNVGYVDKISIHCCDSFEVMPACTVID